MSVTRLGCALVVVVLAGASRPAWSSCETSSDFWDQANACGRVFVGRVVGNPPASSGPGLILAVETVLQSQIPQRQVTILAPIGIAENSGSLPPLGSRFVFVLVRFEDTDFYTTDAGECSQVAMLPLDEAHDVRWFRGELDRRAAAARPRLAESCAKGSDRACYQLGCMYEEGHGAPRDLSSARAFYRRAYELEEGIVEE